MYSASEHFLSRSVNSCEWIVHLQCKSVANKVCIKTSSVREDVTRCDIYSWLVHLHYEFAECNCGSASQPGEPLQCFWCWQAVSAFCRHPSWKYSQRLAQGSATFVPFLPSSCCVRWRECVCFHLIDWRHWHVPEFWSIVVAQTERTWPMNNMIHMQGRHV
jgi:hypothetical protein